MSSDTPCLPAEGYVRLPVILKILGVGRSTWLNGVRDGRFPKPYRIGAYAVAWKVAEIRALLESFERVE